MTYTKVQCIGLVTNTDHIYCPEGTGVGEPTGTASSFYYRGEKTPSKDRSAHLKKFIKMVKEAARSDLIDHDQATLKVVCLPEFFLRSAQGAYSLKDIPAILRKIRDQFHEEQWLDWLFIIPAVAYLEIPRHPIFGLPIAEILNMALIQKGGIAEPDGTHERIVYKEAIAENDFLTPRKYSPLFDDNIIIGNQEVTKQDIEGSRDSEEPPQKKQRTEEGHSLAGGGIFEMDGIRIGLEICIDHLYGRLKKAETTVQLHIITSAGMAINPEHVVAVPDGIVFLVDGLTKHQPEYGDSLLHRVSITDTTGTELSPIIHSIAEIPHPSASIKIYPPQDLPPMPPPAAVAALFPDAVTTNPANQTIDIDPIGYFHPDGIDPYPEDCAFPVITGAEGNEYTLCPWECDDAEDSREQSQPPKL